MSRSARADRNSGSSQRCNMEPGDFTRLTDWREEPASPGPAKSGVPPGFTSAAPLLVFRNLTGFVEWLARLLAIGDIRDWIALVGFMTHVALERLRSSSRAS